MEIRLGWKTNFKPIFQVNEDAPFLRKKNQHAVYPDMKNLQELMDKKNCEEQNAVHGQL